MSQSQTPRAKMNRQNSIKRDRSFDSVVYKLLRMRNENQESFKSAMYNFLIAAGIAAFAAVCIILGPFVKPLIWAFLIGAVLFPFKRKLASLLNEWFNGLEETDANIFVAISLAPIQVTEYSGRVLVNWLKNHWKMLATGIGIAICIKFVCRYAPKGVLCSVWRLIVFGHSSFSLLINFLTIYQVIFIIATYLITVKLLWNKENSKCFIITGQALWILLIGYVCSFFSALQVPLFIVIMLYSCVAMIYYLHKNTDANKVDEIDFENSEPPPRNTIVDRFLKLMDKQVYTEAVNKIYQSDTDLEFDEKSCSEILITESSAADEVEKIEQELTSSYYFKYLFYSCLATFLYRNVWMFLVAFIPISIHLFYKVAIITGFWNLIETKLTLIWNITKEWCLEHHSAVLPLCLPGLLELNYKIQRFIRSSLKSSVDLVTSTLMIVLMILIVFLVGIFFCINIYSETIEVAYLGKDLINKTITNRPELIDILPTNFQDSIDDALDNAHTYGRRRIEQYINDMLKDADPVHGTKLKKQILDVWDRLIQFWIDYNKSESIGPRVPTDALRSTFGEIVDNPGHFKELVLVAKQGILGWAKSNTNTIMEVAESIWHIIRTNLSMIMSVTGEIFSLILSGGQAFIEFFLDMIVFFTALFYLLTSSDRKYAPLHIGDYLGSASGNKIADTLENSISGVLIAMFKCSVFQGLFTWLVHTVLGARIVFLPSALAAVLSAAPFLGSYWVAIPAFLELWLAQDRFYAGVLLFLLLFFVPQYLEAEVHAEIKGAGHVYLTGLAIAGGMYWLGWQGAIFGPLMLCFFIGIFEVASLSLKNDDTNEKSLSEEDNKTKQISTAKIESQVSTQQPVNIRLVKKTISTVLPNNPVPWSAISNQKNKPLIVLHQSEDENMNN